uniref:interferon regulatory factor 7 isoform X1 n=1 Tax=Pristiophorus japonicus TaxID=55135 RepID=UPI00398F0423
MGKQRMNNNHKPQLQPWLMEQVASGRYQGLAWVNGHRSIFRIPWKHASRQDLCEDDYRIFKDWAIASGKFTAGDSADPARWKTNFRCALNSIESFRMLQDNSKESSDPHKIYSINGHIPSPAPDARIGAVPEGDDELESRLYISPETDLVWPNFTLYAPQQSSAGPYHQDQLEEFIPDLTMVTLSDTGADQMAPGLLQLRDLSTLPMGGHGMGLPPLGPPPQEARLSPAQVVPSDQQWEPVPVPRSHNMENLAQEVPAQFPAPDLPVVQARVAQLEVGAPGQQSITQLTSELDITIYYRGKEVLHTTVSNNLGCRLYHNEEDERFAHLQHIRFPSTGEISDHRQMEFTDRLLSNMEGGLLLEYKNGILYARRLGKCQVFCSRSDLSQIEDSEKLTRDVETKIFSLRDFIVDLVAFKEQKRGVPLCSTYLCFGQHFLTGNPRRKLILVQVVPRVCTLLVEMAHQQGASSLNSENASLQISNASSIENLWALVREIESMEVDLP